MHQKKLEIIKNAGEIEEIPPPRKALTKIEHVRGEMASVYRQCRAGNIDSQEAGRLTYILVSLAKLIEQDDLERRVEEMERKVRP